MTAVNEEMTGKCLRQVEHTVHGLLPPFIHDVVVVLHYGDRTIVFPSLWK